MNGQRGREQKVGTRIRHLTGESKAMAVVLIVEDDDQVRVLAESIIQDRRHTTLSASTVEQALALLEGEQRVDLLFTDLGLHDDLEAGLKAAQAAVERIPGLPVLYTTGQAITDGMRAMFVERSGFIAKPYTVNQLSAAIDNLLPAREPN
jgi:DNA-binding NtrC family response regulator